MVEGGQHRNSLVMHVGPQENGIKSPLAKEASQPLPFEIVERQDDESPIKPLEANTN